MTDDMGSAIGSMIGLGIGVVIAKKLLNDDKETAPKKKPTKEVSKNFIQRETGAWN